MKKIKKEERNKKMKGKRGITLIALIITIIVMLILVAVTINVAISSGLFGTAKKAVRKMDLAKLQEDWMITKYANYNTTTDRTNVSDGTLESVFGNKYEQYNDQFAIENGELVYIGTDATMKQCAKELGIEILPPFETSDYGTILTENKKYTDGGEAIIPKGFKVVTEGQNISDGLVIQDASGNEFVWIPVNPLEFKRIEYNKGVQVAACTEPYASGYDGGDGIKEKAEYDAMVASVKANKGFYIGRYEAGSTVQRTSSSAPATTPVVKKDQYPYNYVRWGPNMNTIGEIGAVYLSQQMYPEESEDYGVASTLCYGVQWDAVLEFIKDSTDVLNSTRWGNYKDAQFDVTNTNAKYSTNKGANWTQVSNTYNKPVDHSVLLTTGATDRNSNKNIYDIAGNVWEWTMEAYGSSYRVSRGGGCYDGGDVYPASSRDFNYPSDYGSVSLRLSPHTLHKVV